MNKIITIGFIIFSQLAMSQEHHTGFDPSIHGFNFVNTFSNDVVKELDIKTNGLCGGMVYAALDYYKTNKRIPQQNHRPAVQTEIHDYIYNRQVHSITENLDKWAELGFNPFGARNGEFFNWGLQGFNGGRIEELRASLDRGHPVPLGLWHADGHSGGDHQVLAIGYKMGRYKGDLKEHKEDFEIYIYDPNFPNETQTLKADPRSQTYYYTNHSKRWLTYFVDRKYRTVTPPSIEEPISHDGKIRQLKLEIVTGNDDLRGGNDNLNIEVHYFNKPMQRFNNVNNSRRWIGQYSQTIVLPLTSAINRNDISHIVLSTNFSGGIGGDNWNVDKVRVMATENGHEIVLKEVEGQPWVRFTGQKHNQQITLNQRAITTVNTTINTTVPAVIKPRGNRCHDSLQNKVAWDYQGHKRWAQANMDRLCGSTRSDQPAKCFNTVMHENVNWGGGSKWQWDNAINLCQGTLNANRTVVCFKNKISQGINWSSAINACKQK